MLHFSPNSDQNLDWYLYNQVKIVNIHEILTQLTHIIKLMLWFIPVNAPKMQVEDPAIELFFFKLILWFFGLDLKIFLHTTLK